MFVSDWVRMKDGDDTVPVPIALISWELMELNKPGLASPPATAPLPTPAAAPVPAPQKADDLLIPL